MQRIGVFICWCGSNIAATVDVEKVAEVIKNEPGVVYSTNYQYMCSENGQQLIKQAIKEHNLTGIVIGACSPRMHEPTFRKAAEAAGLNPYMVEIANIREHCSWIHKDMEEATEKAVVLYRKGIEQPLIFLSALKSESLGQQFPKHSLRIMQIRTAAQNDKTFIAKLVQNLSAYTAGRGFAVLGADDRNRNEFLHTLRNRFGYRTALCTKCGRICGVFDITARKNPSVRTQKSRTHIKMGKGSVCKFSRFHRRVQKRFPIKIHHNIKSFLKLSPFRS